MSASRRVGACQRPWQGNEGRCATARGRCLQHQGNGGRFARTLVRGNTGGVAGYVIIEAPSVLGLFPGGVEDLPEALLGAGLADALGADHAGRVIARPYDSTRDPATGLLNPAGLRDYAHELADATGEVLDGGGIPIVLGGDCSILLGNLLALSRRGRFGLLFIDGHADFYQPDAEPRGEAASMDLALATGRGPSIVADLEGRGPLVLDEDVVQLGRRDAEEAAAAGSQRIEDTAITVIDLEVMRQRGPERAAHDALGRLGRPELAGFWIHLDCDVKERPQPEQRRAEGRASLRERRPVNDSHTWHLHASRRRAVTRRGLRSSDQRRPRPANSGSCGSDGHTKGKARNAGRGPARLERRTGGARGSCFPTSAAKEPL
jgi:arginase